MKKKHYAIEFKDYTRIGSSHESKEHAIVYACKLHRQPRQNIASINGEKYDSTNP